jgi:hypothetical protein
LLQKEAELNAKNNGIEVLPQNGNNGHRSLATAVDDFLEDTKLTKKSKTLAAYTTSLSYFIESCPKQFLEEIERKDLLKFAAFLRDDKDQAPRKVVAERGKLNKDNSGCTNFEQRSQLAASGPASICERCSSGSGTRIWKAQCGT